MAHNSEAINTSSEYMAQKEKAGILSPADYNTVSLTRYLLMDLCRSELSRASPSFWRLGVG